MAARTVRRRLAGDVPLEDRDIEDAAPVDEVLHKAMLMQALTRLPEHYREPIVLHHLLGMSFRDIAGIVGSREAAPEARYDAGAPRNRSGSPRRQRLTLCAPA
jgi:DNA-directed RNA polymerase specialized sigma24 family protein